MDPRQGWDNQQNLEKSRPGGRLAFFKKFADFFQNLPAFFKNLKKPLVGRPADRPAAQP
jgi:hypothetical protein